MKANTQKLVDRIRAAAHRKEDHFTHEYVALVKSGGELRAVVTLRIYQTNARAYCCVWLNNPRKGEYGNGSGYAGGYGYHRSSAAAQYAIDASGVVLSERIDGRGNTAIEEAVEAIAYSFGFRNIHVHVAHA